MAERIFTVTIAEIGALASSPVFAFKFPFDVQLLAACASNSTANAGTLKIGKTGDDDAYLTATNFGVSSAVAEVKTFAGFAGVDAGGQFPHIAAGTTILVTITDHGSHMADEFVMLTFSEG